VFNSDFNTDVIPREKLIALIFTDMELSDEEIIQLIFQGLEGYI
jgi:hypothetical protein